MAGGEAAMVAALYLGLRRAEASVVIPCYYGSMTVFAAVQGLLLFDLGPSLSAGGAAGFSCGIALCVASLGAIGAGRRRAEASRAAPLLAAAAAGGLPAGGPEQASSAAASATGDGARPVVAAV